LETAKRQAQDAYDAVEQQAWEALQAASQDKLEARKAYDAVEREARKQRDAALREAQDVYEAATRQTLPPLARVNDQYDLDQNPDIVRREFVAILPDGVVGGDYVGVHTGEIGEFFNILAAERTDDQGGRSLFTRQLQSDLAQEIRREKDQQNEIASAAIEALKQHPDAQHFDMRDTGVPLVWVPTTPERDNLDMQTRAQLEEMATEGRQDALPPLTARTSQWTGAGVRAMVLKAAREGFDSVSFPTGVTSTLIQGNDKAAAHYDTNVRGALEKVARALGGEVRVGGVQYDNELTAIGGTPNLARFIGATVEAEAGPGGPTGAVVIRDSSGRLIETWADMDGARRSLETNQRLAKAVTSAKGAPAYILDITPEMRARLAGQGLPLFQPQGAQGPKGVARLYPELHKTVIRLFEGRDASTFMHESAHFFLEVMLDLARYEETAESVKGDVQTLLEWFGVENLTMWDALPLEARRPHHEKFARGFEAYLREGKAPSLKLRSIFAEFAAWLTRLYRSITDLHVSLTDDVRDVMDRMIATETEIAEARRAAYMDTGLFKERPPSMTEAQWQRYQAGQAEARMHAEETLRTRVMASTFREREDWWKRETAKQRRAVELAVNGQPVYRAIAWLADGRWLDGIQPAEVVQYHTRVSMQAAEQGAADGGFELEQSAIVRIERKKQNNEDMAKAAKEATKCAGVAYMGIAQAVGATGSAAAAGLGEMAAGSLLGLGLGALFVSPLAVVAGNVENQRRNADFQAQEAARLRARADEAVARWAAQGGHEFDAGQITERNLHLWRQVLAEQGIEGVPREAPIPMLAALFAQAEGVDPRYLLNMVMRESGGNPLARSSTSSASGLTQFINSTWDAQMRRSGANYGYAPETYGGIGSPQMRDLRFDPRWSLAMGAALTRDNADALRVRLGIEPTHADGYGAHFMGVDAYIQLLRLARSSDGIAASRFPGAAASNRTIFYENQGHGRARRASEVIQNLYSRMLNRPVLQDVAG
jgi:hypothetical protein